MDQKEQEELQKEFEEKNAAILEVLKGLSHERAIYLLNAVKNSLGKHSTVN